MGADLAVPERMDGRVVIVTGANTGCGFHSARALHRLGATVVLACRSRERGEAAAAAIGGGGRAVFLPLDLSDFATVENFVEAFHARFGRANLHGLVCSAGINSGGAKLQSANSSTRSSRAKHANLVFRVNYTSHFLLVRRLLDDLRRSGTADRPSRLVVLSSVMHTSIAPSAEPAWENLAGAAAAAAYSPSKLALHMLATFVDEHEAPHHVRGVAVNPGAVNSDIWRGSSGLTAWAASTFFLTPEQGATTTVAAVASPGLERRPYLVPSLLPRLHDDDGWWCRGYGRRAMMLGMGVVEAGLSRAVYRHARYGTASRLATNLSACERLWAASLRLTV